MKWQRETGAEVRAMKFTAFSQFRAQNGRASMRFYSAAPYRGHLSAGICFCLSVGGCVEPQERWGRSGGGGGGEATVNMTDGRDDGIWAALEQTSAAKISRRCFRCSRVVAKAAIPRPSAPTEHPLDANRYYLAARNEAKSRRGMLEQRALSFLFSYIYVSIIRSSQIYQVSSLLSFLNWSNYLVNCNGMSC